MLIVVVGLMSKYIVCLLLLLKLTIVNTLDHHQIVCAAFLGLRKAFDSLDHSGMLKYNWDHRKKTVCILDFYD